ncbi:MAG TPA: beta-galactosidase [Terracidiphilus sp.]|nr:beta-galactosidase [Terracidiphilus sp.]
MKAKFARTLLLCVMALLGSWPACAADRPLLGAEIWIEPGQTPSQIDTWFHDLADAHMPVARLFLMWPYLEPAPNEWTFTLYDAAFRAAEKYRVRIVATLTPSGLPPFLGGDGSQGGGVLPTAKDRLLAATYIAKVVERYRSSSALDTWLLVNEPGQEPVANPAAITAFRKWLTKQYSSVSQMNAAWGSAYKEFDVAQPPASRQLFNRNRELDWRAFWEDYQTAQLHWLADEVRKSDSGHPLHLNPAGLLSNLAGVSDDLPSWRTFLDTLGCSIHPAWHFGLLNRDQYALGVSYLNDLVRGSIEPKPYWVTELQGGNNIYSGHRPMNPATQDIAQWVWTSIGAGADRIVFWLLNSRAEGLEAGEWSLLDFQGHPSERLKTAANIADIVNQHESFFSQARPYHSQVTILLSPDTMNFEEVFNADDDPARSRNAHILSVLGFYEALSRLGLPPDIKYFNDYDWDAATKQRRVAILPDARVLTETQIHSLHSFIDHGNTLLITGLTGFYGPHATAWPLKGFPLAEITGGQLKEVYLRGKTPLVSLTAPSDMVLPSRFWISSIDSSSTAAIGRQNDEVIATERDVSGGGRVIWIPSPIGIGAWLTDVQPLTQYLQASLGDALSAPFTLAQPQDGCLLRVLENNGAYVTVLTNGAETSKTCEIKAPPGLHATTLWKGMSQAPATVPTYTLEPQGTFVQLWR